MGDLNYVLNPENKCGRADFRSSGGQGLTDFMFNTGAINLGNESSIHLD